MQTLIRVFFLQIYSFGGYCSNEQSDGTEPIDIHMLNTCKVFFLYNRLEQNILKVVWKTHVKNISPLL